MPHLTRADETGPDGAVPKTPGVIVRSRDRAVADTGGSGLLASLEITAGAGEQLHRHLDVDEAVFVLSGAATVTWAEGKTPAPAGTLVLSPRGCWHALRADDEPVTALMMYAGTGDRLNLTAETSDSTEVSGEGPRMIDSTSIQRTPIHEPERGFHHMAATFLVGETGLRGAELIVGDAAYGTPDLDGGHELHRHPLADEFIFLRSGRAVHRSEEGEIPLGPGDLVVIPAGEWHGIWNAGSQAATALFGYLGVATHEDTGYEMPD